MNVKHFVFATASIGVKVERSMLQFFLNKIVARQWEVKYTRKVRGCSESLFISLNDVKDALKEVQLIVVKALIDVSFSLCA